MPARANTDAYTGGGARMAASAAPRLGDLSVPARANTDASTGGGARMAASAAPRLGDLSVAAQANTDASTGGGARMAASAAPRLGDLSVAAQANTDGGLHGGPGGAFVRMAISAVRSSAKFSGRPLAQRFQALAVTDTEVRHARKRTLHLQPMPPGSSPPKMNLYGDNDNGKWRKTGPSAFSHD